MKKALLLTGIYWESPWQRHQQFASYLSKLGYEVYFVEHIVSSKFSLRRILEIIKSKKLNGVTEKQKMPANIHLVNMGFINPGKGFFALVNYFKVKKMNKIFGKKYDIVINYLPINTTRFILNDIHSKKVIYDCVRNFIDWGSYYKSVHKEEKRLCNIVDAIFCDSYYLKNKFSELKIPVMQFLPIANEDWLKGCIRKRSVIKIKKIGYFGTIGEHVDTDVFQLLIKLGYEIHFWGVISCDINMKIYKHGYVTDLKFLASQIMDTVDAIIIPYRGNMDGVMPAKLLQALSTGLPVFCSDFYDSRSLSEYLYVYKKKGALIELIRNYNLAQHNNKIKKIEELLGGKIEDTQFQRFKNAIE